MTRVWMASGNLTYLRTAATGAGASYDAAICFGGVAAGASNVPEIFNGTTWSVATGSNMTARSYCCGCGTQTAALCISGYTAGTYILTESYDGTTWLSGGNLPFGSIGYQGMGCGSTVAAMFRVRTSTATYNGVVWTNLGAIGTLDRNYPAGYGTKTDAIVAGGYGTNVTTELFNGAVWGAGGNIITGRNGAAGCGTSGTGVMFGGTVATEECNGTTWSASSNLNTSRSPAAGAGIQSAAVAFSGATTSSEIYDTQVLAAPVADFSGTPTSGLAPLTVVFTDLTTNTPTTWDWDWGDGSTHGTTMNPTHIFTIPGTFTITLIVTNAYGTDTEAKVAYIGVSGTAGAVAVGDKVLIANVKGVPVIVRQ